MTTLKINGQTRTLSADPDMPLLWALREDLKLTGTKFGCGIAQCGACTVHVDGQPQKSCSMSLAMAEGTDVTTIEAIASEGELHAVQQAWIDHQVPQCGYCQSGQIMSAVALLRDTPNPTDADIDTAMRGNVCRCGMYGRIKDAIKSAAKSMPQPVSEGDAPSDDTNTDEGVY